MFLSIIIAVYNTERYISECLDSLLEQDYPKDDYEIICINDGSTDDSLSILEAYRSQCSNVVILNQSNKGVCRARNAGLEIAKGDYVWFVDSDDFIQTIILGKLKRLINQSQCDMLTVGIYTFFEVLSDQEKSLKKRHEIKENVIGKDVYIGNHLFRTVFLQDNDLLFKYPELKFAEDAVFICEVIMANPKRAYVNEAIYYYRKNSNSVTMNKEISSKNTMESCLSVARIMKGYYESGYKDTHIANLWMRALWIGMQQLSLLNKREIAQVLYRLISDHVWPVKRPPECTHKQSYMTARKDFYGKLVDCIYMHSHTVMGFMVLRVFSVVHKLVKYTVR